MSASVPAPDLATAPVWLAPKSNAVPRVTLLPLVSKVAVTPSPILIWELPFSNEISWVLPVAQRRVALPWISAEYPEGPPEARRFVGSELFENSTVPAERIIPWLVALLLPLSTNVPSPDLENWP